MPAELKFHCAYCGPSQPVGPQVIHNEAFPEEVWRQWWKDNGPGQNSDMQCMMCGALHDFADDGIPASSGGGLDTLNVSQPTISDLNPSFGDAGDIAIIAGDFLEVGNLTIKIGDKVAIIQARTKTAARIVIPSGTSGTTLDVTVQNDVRPTADTLVAGFTYN